MARMRYAIGDKVLVSRAETGEDHEAAEVVDSYELIINEERRPMVVVEFEDGERKYMTAATPNVLPGPEDETEDAATGESTDEAEAAAVEREELGAEAAGDETSASGVRDDDGVATDDEFVFAEEEEGASP